MMFWIKNLGVVLATAALFFPSALVVANVDEGEGGPVIGTLEVLTSDCPEIWQEFCARESNRYCYVDNDAVDEQKTCGTCLPGFVEWRVRCLNEREVGIVEFLEEFAPKYLNPISDEDRLQLLLDIIGFIEQHQNQNPPPTYELALNEFSADSEADVKSRTGFSPNLTITAEEDLDRAPPPLVQSGGGGPPPSKMDWVEGGAVTVVKDQGRCGCCWAVTVVGAVEGAVAVNTGYLQSLSFQQLISCDDDNLGCNGGNLVYAVTYAVKNAAGGLATAFDYEYTDYEGSTTEQCATGGKPLAVRIDGGNYVVDYYDDLSFEDRMFKMKQAVAVQPVAIVIRSNCRTISNYKSGVITEDEACACDGPLCADHAVLLVGYNDEANPPYWKVKNSWSDRWGEDGYFRVAQTQKGPYGLFGILLHGVVPQMAYNITGQVLEAGSGTTSDGLEWWVWLLIALGAAGLCCFVMACFCGNRK
jgi:C1A family cysteine protease